MHKLQVAYLVTVAVLSIFLQCRVDAEHPIYKFDRFFPPDDGLNSIIDEVIQKYTEKCKKAAEGVESSTIYHDFEKGVTELTTCITGVTNVTAIEEEIEKARDMDKVFNKHCTNGVKCLRDFNEKLQPCRSASHRDRHAVNLRIVTDLFDFMCSMNTSHIKRFFDEGFNCLLAKQVGINACYLFYISNALPKDFNDLLLGPGHCREWEGFQRCHMREVERCQGKTLESVPESIFEIIKNGQGCTKKEPVDVVIKLLDCCCCCSSNTSPCLTGTSIRWIVIGFF